MDKVSFGVKGLQGETPSWAKWMFRITMLVTSSITIWVAATTLVPENIKIEAMLALKVLDTFVFGLSKFFGITHVNDEQ